MIWQITWEGDSTAGMWAALFGENLEATLIEGIEAGMEELEWLQAVGNYCEACGEFRHTQTVEMEDSAPTDRGEEFRLLPYELCLECRREMFGSPI